MVSPIKGSTGNSRLIMLLLALILVPLALGLAGCGDDVEQEIEEAIDEAVEEVTAHTVEVTGFTCPIPPDTDTGDPEAGNVFASVSVTIKNDSDVEQLVSAADFTLEDEDGTIYDPDILYSGPGALGAAETVATGEEISGIIVFEVPADAKPMYLVENTIVSDPVKIELPEATPAS